MQSGEIADQITGNAHRYMDTSTADTSIAEANTSSAITSSHASVAKALIRNTKVNSTVQLLAMLQRVASWLVLSLPGLWLCQRIFDGKLWLYLHPRNALPVAVAALLLIGLAFSPGRNGNGNGSSNSSGFKSSQPVENLKKPSSHWDVLDWNLALSQKEGLARLRSSDLAGVIPVKIVGQVNSNRTTLFSRQQSLLKQLEPDGSGLKLSHQAALLANHGVIGLGDDLKEALHVCEVVEKISEVYISALKIGPIFQLETSVIERQYQAFLAKKARQRGLQS